MVVDEDFVPSEGDAEEFPGETEAEIEQKLREKLLSEIEILNEMFIGRCRNLQQMSSLAEDMVADNEELQ